MDPCKGYYIDWLLTTKLLRVFEQFLNLLWRSTIFSMKEEAYQDKVVHKGLIQKFIWLVYRM